MGNEKASVMRKDMLFTEDSEKDNELIGPIAGMVGKSMTHHYGCTFRFVSLFPTNAETESHFPKLRLI